MPLAYLAHLQNLSAVERSIRRGELRTANTLAAHLKVVTRTVYRYIDTLKNEFGAPIEFTTERGYYLRRPWDFSAAVVQWLKRQGK